MYLKDGKSSRSHRVLTQSSLLRPCGRSLGRDLNDSQVIHQPLYLIGPFSPLGLAFLSEFLDIEPQHCTKFFIKVHNNTSSF